MQRKVKHMLFRAIQWFVAVSAVRPFSLWWAFYYYGPPARAYLNTYMYAFTMSHMVQLVCWILTQSDGYSQLDYKLRAPCYTDKRKGKNIKNLSVSCVFPPKKPKIIIVHLCVRGPTVLECVFIFRLLNDSHSGRCSQSIVRSSPIRKAYAS